MGNKHNSVWAVVRKVNPHVPSSGDYHTVVVYAEKADADNFIAKHPQYHYHLGRAEPKIILDLKEIELDTVADWWNPLFP